MISNIESIAKNMDDGMKKYEESNEIEIKKEGFSQYKSGIEMLFQLYKSMFSLYFTKF